jgi:hypothetical protein
MIPAKEYMDKMFTFQHNGAIYVFTSCIQNISPDEFPREFKNESSQKAKIDHCESILNIYKFWTGSDGRVVGKSLIQSDSKLEKIPNLILIPVMTKAMVKYRQDWVKYLTKYNKEI